MGSEIAQQKHGALSGPVYLEGSVRVSRGSAESKLEQTAECSPNFPSASFLDEHTADA